MIGSRKRSDSLMAFIRNHPRLDYVAILLISAHVLIWFTNNSAVEWSDFVIPLDATAAIHNLASIWSSINLGNSLPSTILVPWVGFFALFQSFGLPLYLTEQIYFYVMWSLAGMSAYYFAQSLGEGSYRTEQLRVLCLVAAVFYEFNLVGYLSIPVTLSYTAFPLILGLFFRGAQTEKGAPIYLLGIGFASYAAVLEYPDFRTIYLVPLVMTAFTIFLLVTRQSKKIRVLLFYLASLATIAALWSWFILPVATVFALPSTLGAVLSRTPTSFGDLGYATLLQVSRLAGPANFDYSPFYSFYLSIPGLILSYAIPLLSFGILLFRPRDKNILFTSAMALGFLFLAAGPNPPFGTAYQWLVLHYWFLRPFITSWYNITGAAVFYSFLIGSLSVNLYIRIQRNHAIQSLTVRRFLSKLMILVLVMLIIGSAFPLASSERLSQYGSDQLPASYHQANAWLSQQDGYTRVLIAPSVPPYATFNWTSKYIGNPYPLLLGVPFVGSAFTQTYTSVGESELVNLAYGSLGNITSGSNQASTDAQQFCGALKVMSIRYVFYDGYYIGSSQSQFDNISRTIGLNPAAKFGAVSIYGTKGNNPRLFASTNAENFSNMTSLLTAACNSQNTFVGFLDNQTEGAVTYQLLITPNQTPAITVTTSALGFRVTVQNASSPFFLVLSESYSPYWKASSSNHAFTHLEANGYSNAWYVSQTGSYTIQVDYWPDVVFLAGSALTVTCVSLLLFLSVRPKLTNAFKRKVVTTRTEREVHSNGMPHQTTPRRMNRPISITND